MMAKRSKIYQIEIHVSRYLQYVEVGRRTCCGIYLRRYHNASDASLTRAYNALRALAGRQEQK